MGAAARLRAVHAEARRFLAGIEEHALFSHAAATGFFLFFAIAPAVLALVALAGFVPFEAWFSVLAHEGRAWLLERIHEGLDPRTGAVAARLADNALAPWFERLEAARDVTLSHQLQGLLEQHLPPSAALALGQFVGDVLDSPRPGLLTFGFVALLWSASGATRSAMRALNAIYEVRRHAFLRRALVSLGLTLAILLGSSFTLTALPLGNAVAQGVVDFFELPAWVRAVWGLVNWLAGLAFMLAVVCVLLCFGPNARQRLRWVLPGAALTVALWVALGVGLRLWTTMGWERTNATYGTLASVIVLLLWCYLVSATLLLGAEVNAWWIARRGHAQRAVAGLALVYARRWPNLVALPARPPRRWWSLLRRRGRRAGAEHPPSASVEQGAPPGGSG